MDGESDPAVSGVLDQPRFDDGLGGCYSKYWRN